MPVLAYISIVVDKGTDGVGVTPNIAGDTLDICIALEYAAASNYKFRTALKVIADKISEPGYIPPPQIIPRPG